MDDRPAASDDDVLTRPARPPDRVMRWGEQEHQVYDVYDPPAPSGGRTPCLVLVHGGFWRAAYDRTHLYPLAAALADRGSEVMLIEYRRTGMPGGGWPVTGLDVAVALQTVRTHETSPQTPVVLVGHSAGAHLAVWALHQPAGAGVCGALALAGALDLALVAELDLGDGAARELLDGIPQGREAVRAAADPARLGSAPVPVHVLHGRADQVVPVAVSRSWWDAAGAPPRDRFEVVEGAGHFALIDPLAPAFTDVARAVEGLIPRIDP